MKAKELIKLLEQWPEADVIMCDSYTASPRAVYSIYFYPNANKVEIIVGDET